MLYFGSRWLVNGSSDLAESLGLTPLVIGLTVVAFGTSSPELFVSVVSALKNKSMIAIGNIIGSNICNIALVLGLTALFLPVTAGKSVIIRDIPIMLGISLYLLLISINSTISPFEGISLLGGLIFYTCYNCYQAKNDALASAPDKIPALKEIRKISSRTQQVILIGSGIAGVVAGADALIDSAVFIMNQLGLSEKFIGLTVVAFGTSLPELSTSVVAALKKEMDISIGNLIGSNVFNILCVLGATSLIKPIQIPNGFLASGILYDYLFMIFVSFLPWLMMRKTMTITRKNGLLLLFCYAGYVFCLISGAS